MAHLRFALLENRKALVVFRVREVKVVVQSSISGGPGRRGFGMDVAMDIPVLWHIPLSHYNEKVRWALDYKGIAHRRRVLGPNHLIRVWRATVRVSCPSCGSTAGPSRIPPHHRST